MSEFHKIPRQLRNKQLPFDNWYKNTFTFSDKTNRLTFTAYYRSEVESTMSLNQAIIEGCENIVFDGVEIDYREDTQQ